jgi:hypothetical protein
MRSLRRSASQASVKAADSHTACRSVGCSDGDGPIAEVAVLAWRLFRQGAAPWRPDGRATSRYSTYRAGRREGKALVRALGISDQPQWERISRSINAVPRSVAMPLPPSHTSSFANRGRSASTYARVRRSIAEWRKSSHPSVLARNPHPTIDRAGCIGALAGQPSVSRSHATASRRVSSNGRKTTSSSRSAGVES